MTVAQMKMIFQYGWISYAVAADENGEPTSVHSSEMDKAFEELLSRDYIAELITK